MRYVYLHPSRTHSLVYPSCWHLLVDQCTCDMDSSFSNPMRVNKDNGVNTLSEEDEDKGPSQ